MLVLGHAGITLGIATALNGALSKKYPVSIPSNSASTKLPFMMSLFYFMAKRIDIRILLVGSLLPDIIDKPVGQILLRDTLSSGRIFGHTLLFLIIISVAGILLYQRRRKNWLLVLSFGTFTHLIFDQMWLDLHTLFWPLLGWNFAKGPPDLVIWIQGIFAGLISEPSVYIPEIIGAVVLSIFIKEVICLRSVGSFLKRGTIATPSGKTKAHFYKKQTGNTPG